MDLSQEMGIFQCRLTDAGQKFELNAHYTYRADHPIFEKKYVKIDTEKTEALDAYLRAGLQRLKEAM